MGKMKYYIEQITKADRDECHAFCEKANSAPRYGGLVPPLGGKTEVENAI